MRMSSFGEDFVEELREDVPPEKLYGTSETYALDSLVLSTEEIGSGGFGNIFKGTITSSYGIQQYLYTGTWGNQMDIFQSFNFWSEMPLKKKRTDNPEQTVTVAIKTIRASEDEALDLIREASNVRVLQGIRNVASVYGVTYNRSIQSVCVVMELVQGPDLNSFLKSGKLATSSSPWLWWKTKLEVFMELVIGLSICHKRGVYHGDLKGKNVLVDKLTVPKLIDFGFSFRKTDVDYLKSLGGSPFWISPELCEGLDEIPEEVLQNPFPSDVYSLGMVLVEMCIDGEVPEYMDSSLMMNKFLNGSPVQLQVPEGMEDLKETIFDEIFAVVDGCCSAERDERISLEQCLVRLQVVYNSICSSICLNTHIQSDAEVEFTSSSGYREMLANLLARFPDVSEAMFQQPKKNMMVDIQGTLVVDLFCHLDFEQGVEFIIEKGMWNFNPMTEVPRLCRICVKQGSPKVLKYLSQRWRAIILQEEWLMHNACEAESLEVLQILLCDVQMDYDTWSRVGQLKPFHKLASRGKVEMMKLLLERADRRSYSQSNYVDTTCLKLHSPRPLEYAIKGDSVEAVFFLLENGGTVIMPVELTYDTDLLEILFFCAMKEGSLMVATKLLEVSYSLKTKDGRGPGDVPVKVLHRFEGHRYGCLHYFEDEFNSYEYVLQLLQSHLAESRSRGVTPLKLACSKEGNDAVFRLVVSFCYVQAYVRLTRSDVIEGKLLKGLADHGSKEMVAYASRRLLKQNVDDEMECPIEHENMELMDPRAWRPHERSITEDVKEGTSHTDEEHSSSLKTLNSDGNDQNYDDEYVKKFLDKSKGYRVDDQTLERLDSLEGITLLDELEKITKAASIWTRVAPNLLKNFAFSGNLEMVEHLIVKRVPVDGPEYSEGAVTETPLMRAASGQHVEVAEKILLAGADPNARMKAGYTCMDIALGYNNTKLIRLLIKFGFDTGSKNRDNETYMDLIAK